ncbi:MAG: hypothetical protein JWP74_3484 [Marmoricola sp.]|nr:hypothetical protein [Marmoricola sp.]
MPRQFMPADRIKARLFAYGMLIVSLGLVVAIWFDGSKSLASGFMLIAALMAFVCARIEIRLHKMRTGKMPLAEIDEPTPEKKSANRARAFTLMSVGLAGFCLMAFTDGHLITGGVLAIAAVALLVPRLSRLQGGKSNGLNH